MSFLYFCLLQGPESSEGSYSGISSLLGLATFWGLIAFRTLKVFYSVACRTVATWTKFLISV